MTRELNVRITMTWWEQDPTTEEEFAEIIKDAILTCTSHEDVSVQVETVKPESEKK